MTRKKVINDSRPSRHDELVAELLANLDEVRAQCGWSQRSDRWAKLTFVGTNSPSVEVEQKCGRGHLDLCISWNLLLCEAGCQSRRSSRSRCGILVEVKSELETWSAGDVIRQLKGYRENFGAGYGCFDLRCKWMRSSMAIFSGRELSGAETTLFKHEHVLIIRPTWRPVVATSVTGETP
jgi:hypothetical protein